MAATIRPAALRLGAMAREWHDKPLRLVFGMLETHDAAAFLKSLAPNVAGIVTVAVPGEAASRSADNAADAARAAGITDVETASDIAAAVKQAATGKPGRVLICGSLYLAGHVLAAERRAVTVGRAGGAAKRRPAHLAPGPMREAGRAFQSY